MSKELFFDTYRSAAFESVPHDTNYVRYILYLTGVAENPPIAPFFYRIIAPLLALPLVDTLPLYKFSGLPADTNEAHLRAIQAFSFLTYIAAIIASIFMYKITRHRFQGSEAAALVALLATMLLVRHTMPLGVDVISIMVISILIYYYENKLIYSLLILLSVGLNEKIIIIFFIVLWARLIFTQNKELLFHIIITSLALAFYFALIKFIIPHHGNEALTDVSGFYDTFKIAIIRSLSLKGIILNVLPFVFLLTLYFMAWKENKLSNPDKCNYFSDKDIIVLLSLFLIGHLLAPVIFNVGRIVMYTFPFYLPLACIYLLRLLNDDSYRIHKS